MPVLFAFASPRLVPTPSRIRCDRNFHPPMQSFPAMFLQSDNRSPNPAVQPVIVSPQVEVKRFGSSVHYVRWKNPGNLWGGLGQTKLHRRHSRTTNNQGDLSAEPETWRQRVETLLEKRRIHHSSSQGLASVAIS